MKSEARQTLRLEFENLCEEYLRTFCAKHELDYEEDAWVGQAGEVAMVGDYFVNFCDMRYDIDNEVPGDTYFEWYDYDLRCALLGCSRKINYPSWCKGAPKPYSEDELRNIEKMHNEVDEATRRFHEYLKENNF